MRIRNICLPIAAGLLLMTGTVTAQPSLNLDFEEKGKAPDKPAAWELVVPQGGEAALDSTTVQAGKHSLRLHRKDQKGEVSSRGDIQPFLAAGKKLRLSGHIKTEKVANGHAGLWCIIHGPKGELAAEEMKENGVKGTTDWKRYQIEVKVDPHATSITFGCLLSGEGTAWFDSLTLELDATPYEQVYRKHFPPLSKDELAWLRKTAIGFKTAEPGTGFEDLQPVKELVGKARIVSLGEATHGTSEFFKMKHRLTEFLACEMGFTLFAMETGMPEAYQLNEHILTGKGDPKELLRRQGHWPWMTEEVLDLVLWMRKFNESGKGRIQFWGFDMQYPASAVKNVRSFIEKAEPGSGYIKTLDAAYEAVPKSFGQFLSLKSEGKDAWQKKVGEMEKGAAAVLDHLEARREEYLKKSPASEVDWVIQNARLVNQGLANLKLELESPLSGSGNRDRYMAANVEWILKQAPPGSKIVLWAHNGHVSRWHEYMGAHLNKVYGKEMVVIGFAFHEGRYRATGSRSRPLDEYDAAPSYLGTIDWYLHQTGMPRLILDIRKASKDSAESAWLTKMLGHRNIGATPGQWINWGNLPKEYDVLIFFDKTTPSRGLGKPSR